MSHLLVSGLAVTPGVPHSLHMTRIRLEQLAPNQLEVRVLEAGICGTDREIIEAHIGRAPDGTTDLVIGHEALAEVVAVGHSVINFTPGDLVTATVRRGCGCPQCAAGASDFCTTMAFTERGIMGRHGYMTDRFIDDADCFVRVPAELRPIGVLIEPTSVAEKAWRVLEAVQQRITSWTPRNAVVFGAGPIGLLQTLVLRARGIDVWTVARRPASETPAAAIVAGCGATYISTRETDMGELARGIGNIDIIVECSGSSEAVEQAIPMLGIGGVLVLLSITNGDRSPAMPLDRINRAFVSGNQTMVGSVNSTVADFEAAISDLVQFEALWPGLAGSLITQRLHSLEDGVGLMESTRGAIKAIIDLA